MGMPTRSELNALLAERLAADPAFRQSLVADPKATVGALVNSVVPDFVKIEVHQETLTHIHLVLPAVVGGGSISDDDLELVAGGAACWDNCGCSETP